ncbi:MAG: hypothetical protein M1816_007015 [Peltula sp. TS41687]|nr:MAG: hypothetical protein M1816_007015 [Peltula sp. TS41687]
MFLCANLLRSAFIIALVTAAAHPQPRLRHRLSSSAFAVPEKNASYDYVVVGGGTAGLAIASRLAETASVAVVESGGFYDQDNGNYSVVPALALMQPFLAVAESYPRQPLIDWGLISSPQTGAANRRIHYAQGKTLGGCSAINIMVYHRATAGTYQRWADLVGDQSYTFPNLLQYFIKSSHLTPPDEPKRNTPNATVLYNTSAFNNAAGGPLQVSWDRWVDPTATWIGRALELIGLPASSVGFNSGSLSGNGAWSTSTISPARAERSSSRTSYLDQAIEETNITIYHHTQAMKILFDKSDPISATGVAVQTQGVDYTLTAQREVILSAGAFRSPHLLMLSVSDLPGVGQNLWDQIYFGVGHEVNTPSGPQLMANPADNSRILEQYLDDAAGPYSSTGIYLAFEKTPTDLRQHFTQNTLSTLDWFPSDWPEIEYIAGVGAGPNGTSFGSISAVLVAPTSRGNVTINSANATDPPVVDMGWLTDTADIEVAIAAFKRARQAWSTIPEIQVGPEVAPGAAVSTDEQILDYIRKSASQIWHASATCAMGKQGDPNAVVDSTAKVFGVRGLRVVDASAFPFALPGHPQASVYMLAEKIADVIKNDR